MDIDSTIESPLLDGCYHIYLDIGANTGVHARKLFEPEKYPNSPYLPMFNNAFGDVEFRRNHTCAIGFELNPLHQDHLNNLQHSYNSKGWRTHFFAPSSEENSFQEEIKTTSEVICLFILFYYYLFTKKKKYERILKCKTSQYNQYRV